MFLLSIMKSAPSKKVFASVAEIERRIRGIEDNHDAMSLQHAILDERQKHHDIEMNSMRVLMDQLMHQVSSNTKSTNQMRIDVLHKINMLLNTQIGLMSAAGLAIGVSIFSWWMGKQ